jgi:hypothetical protein
MANKHPLQAIIERWPTKRELAEDAGVSPVAVIRWHQRASIPAKYDARLLDAAMMRGIPLTWRELVAARSVHVDQGGHVAVNLQASRAAE